MAPLHDIVIVGAGPIGLTLGLVLHAYGRKAVILERHAAHYPQPRAVGIFHQAVQVYDALGLHDTLFTAAFQDLRGQVSDMVEFVGTDGKPLVSLFINGTLKNGSSRSFGLHQPALETVLESICRSRGISVIRSTQVIEVQDQDSQVQIRVSGLGGEELLFARFVVGCDGAKSIVRRSAGIESVDGGGIRSRWLVVDVTPKSIEDARQWRDAYSGKQYMDWRRPHTAVPSSLERRRWEFILLPHETLEEAKNPAFAWSQLAKFGCTPENANLERSAVHTLEGKWAETFHKGRILLAGDAAHTTPPFLGQGLNSGLRDANNLAWRLDFALRNPDKNYQRLFRDFSDEQRNTSKRLVQEAVGLEKLFCVIDREQALRRDAMLAQGPLHPPPDLEMLDEPGMFIPTPPGKFQAHEGPGHQFIDDIVEIDHARGRLYELIKFGWVILQADSTDNGVEAVSARTMQEFDEILRGTRLTIGRRGFRDIKGSMARFFHDNGIVGVILRPDHYVYAVATEARELEGLVDRLLRYTD